jgi:MFS transporter, PPP family, 3-phenylpropionic acid transporter
MGLHSALDVPQTRACLRLYASLMAPDIRGIKWAFVLVGVADGTLLPFIPIYLLERGLGPAAIGGVLAGMALVWLFAGLACGYLADHRFSAERIVLAGTAAAAALALTLALAGDGTTLALLILALTLVRTPLTLLDAIVLRKLRGFSRTGYARIRLRMSAGWAVSAIASGAAYQVFGLRLIPFIYAPLTAVVALWIWRAVKPEAMAPPIEANPVGKGVRLDGIPLAMAGFLFSGLLLGVSLAATQNFVTLQISVLGGGALLIAAAAAFQALTEIPTMGYTHVLTRHLSHRALFAIGCAIYLAVFVAWAVVSNPLVVALLKLVVGVAFALTYVASVTIANDLAPARLRATGQALVKSTMFGLAPIVGAFGGGIVYGALGARLMFLASTVVVAAAGAIAMLVVPAATRAVDQPIVAAEAAAPATP